MTIPVSTCRGFTHPVILLIRSSFPTSPKQSHHAARSLRWLQPSQLRLNNRTFTSASTLRNKATPSAANKKPILTSSRKTPQRSNVASLGNNIQPSHMSFAQHLARKSIPTVLYEAASQKGFLLSSYAAGLFCLSGAGINIWVNFYNAPEEVHWAVPYAFAAMGLVMAGFGMKFALMPASVIRSIKVLPTSTANVNSVASKAGTIAPSVQLEIMARRNTPIPGLPLRRIQIEPHNVVMKSRLYNPKVVPSGHERRLLQQQEEKRKKEEREYELNHIMTAPFRHARWAISTIFAGLRRGLTGEGFAPIIINDASYKLDITGGYALDGGQALDRIVKIDKDPRLAGLESVLKGKR